MVKAFTEEYKPKELLENAQKEVNLLTIKENNNEIDFWQTEELNKYDKKYTMTSYYDVQYDIQEIELE